MLAHMSQDQINDGAIENIGLVVGSLSNHQKSILLAKLVNDVEGITHLPELHNILGDKLWKFLEIFSGTSIQVPSTSNLKNAVYDTLIYSRLKDQPKGNVFRVERELSSELGISREAISKRYKKMAKVSGSFDL